MTNRIGPEPREPFFQIISVVNAMKDALLHHFAQSRTLEADLNAPHRRFAIPNGLAMLIGDQEPEILKPALVRRLILDFMRLVIDQSRERCLASPKGQTRNPTPALANQIRTID